MRKNRFKEEIIREEVDPSTGDVLSFKKETRIIRENDAPTFLMTNTSDIKLYRKLTKDRLLILFLLCYNANPHDSSIMINVSVIDEIALFIGSKRETVRNKINMLVEDLFLVELWGKKYRVNPSIMILMGIRFHQKNIRLFNEALEARMKDSNKKIGGYAKEWEDINNDEDE